MTANAGSVQRAVVNIEVRDPSRLGEVNGEIHDWFFDLGDVALDRENRELVIPFRRWSDTEATRVSARSVGQRILDRLGGKHWEAPWYRWMLTIGEATDFVVLDDALIGGADFSRLVYEGDRSIVRVEGNPPVVIEVAAAALKVSVRETGEAIGVARYFETPGGGLSYSGEVFPLRRDGA